jgi:hypothetical protein
VLVINPSRWTSRHRRWTSGSAAASGRREPTGAPAAVRLKDVRLKEVR